MLIIDFKCADPEIAIALLTEFPFEGFQEFPEKVEAYMVASDWHEKKEEILKALGTHAVLGGVSEMPQVNWNETWESSFQPVVIDDFCHIRASFHPPVTNCQYELIIDPKMAFGTGHHETTELMIRQMRYINLAGKTVLDLGSGTGILGILALKMGAQSCLAIDNDPEATENATENASLNGVPLETQTGTLESLVHQNFEVILANINRNVLLSLIPLLPSFLNTNGILLLSGILVTDEPVMQESLTNNGFIVQEKNTLGEWMNMLCIR